MTRLFSHGVVDIVPDSRFAFAVLVGAAGWVGLATVWRLPVSTTHALIGALVGAGLVMASGSVRWSALIGKVAAPLLIGAVLAYAIWATVGGLARRRAQVGAVGYVQRRLRPEGIRHRIGIWLHWMSAGLVSAARGLNDTPKLAAVAGFALVPAGFPSSAVIVGVGVSMLGGAVMVGGRVARRLGEDVTRLDHLTGLQANLTTATLVGLGGARGLPMSTHVSTGPIAGVTGLHAGRLNLRTLRDFGIAWIAIPVVAGLVAALTSLLT